MNAVAALSSHPDWWSGWTGVLIGGVLGAVLGSSIPLGWRVWQRRRERRGEIRAMQAELRLAEMDMTSLIDEVAAPLYRLPLSMFERALPKLIGEGELTFNEIGLLVEYVNRAEELNRGLDRAAEASMVAANFMLPGEFERNQLKAEAILREILQRHGNRSLRDGAWDALLRIDEPIAGGCGLGFVIVGDLAPSILRKSHRAAAATNCV
jgi:hypothetical protein